MDNNTSKGDVGVCTVLFLIFLVLKLTGTIAWSWWWVCAPIWIPIAFVVIILLIAFIVGLIASK